MKKTIAVLVTVALLLMSAAIAEGTIRTNGSCNVRTGPGLDYDTVGTMKKGSTASYTGDSEVDDRGVTWYCINWGSHGECWVSSKYAKLSRDPDEEPEYDDDSWDDSDNVVVCTGGECNIRTGAGTGYSKLGSFNRGDVKAFAGKIGLDDRGVEWYSVSTKKGTGWVSSKYTRLYTDMDVEYVDFGGDDDDDDDDYDDVSGDTVRGVSGDSNIRSGPGLDYAQIGVLAKGRTADFTGSVSTDDRGVDWYSIYYKGKNGWVSSRYTELDADDVEYVGVDDDDDYDGDTDDDFDEEDTNYVPLSDFVSGDTYQMDLNSLKSSLSIAYGKSGYVYMKADSPISNEWDPEDAFDFSYLPSGDIGAVLYDLDADGADELLVVGQTVDQRVKISVYESQNGTSVLASGCTVDVSVQPLLDYKNTQLQNNMNLQVFIYNGGHIAIAKRGLEGMRGDGTSLNFVSCSYKNGQITADAWTGFAGSDWDEAGDLEYTQTLRGCGLNIDFEQVVTGQKVVSDYATFPLLAAEMTSIDMVDYESLVQGSAVSCVSVTDLSGSVLPVFTFE